MIEHRPSLAETAGSVPVERQNLQSTRMSGLDRAVTPRLSAARIGRFAVLHLLGAGGMGQVYAAYDAELDRKIAIKLLLAEDSVDAEGRTRLLREAQAMARVSHPNVVPIFEVGEHEGGIFIAMEYVDGTTLRDWCAEASRSWRELVAVYLQAARGLAAAHGVGIIHRDFKPDNALVSVEGEPRVRVLDFGLAALPGAELSGGVDVVASPSADDRLTLTGAVMGTPAYMAPEQQRGGDVDARADVFALCVALYEAIYGVRPFAGATVTELFAAVQAGELRPPPEGAESTPRELRDLLRRGLAVDPEARWPSMSALAEALAGLLDEKEERARDRRRGLRVRLRFLTAAALLASTAIIRQLVAPSAARSTTGHQLRFNAVAITLLAISVVVSYGTLRRSRYERRVFAFISTLVLTLTANNLNFHLRGLTLEAALTTDMVLVAGFFIVGSMLLERLFALALLPCGVGIVLLVASPLPAYLAFELTMLTNLVLIGLIWLRRHGDAVGTRSKRPGARGRLIEALGDGDSPTVSGRDERSPAVTRDDRLG